MEEIMYQLIEDQNYEEQLATIILDASKKIIPSNLKTFLSRKSNRKKMLDQFGSKSFLMPDKLKFPVVDQSGNIHKGLVKAAYMRARQHGYTDVAAKAKDMMQECGEIDIKISVTEHAQTYEIDDLLNILELDFSSINAAQTDDSDFRRVFRDPDGNIIIKAGDKIEWTDSSGETMRGYVKSVDGSTAIVDVDGEEKTLEL
jgi:hypothetical protein